MRFGRRQVLTLAVGAFFAFAAIASATPAKKADIPTAPPFLPTDLVAPAGADWATNGGDYGQTRYSTLNQVTTANVTSLKEAWHIHLNGSATGGKYKGEGTPLVYKGIMYAVTGNSDVFAVNATTGAILCHYSPHIPHNTNTTSYGSAAP